MMVFYVLLYYVWRTRYEIKGRAGLIAAVYGLAAARVILCMMPQNQWMSASAPLSWGIYRNIPFALMGLLIIVLFYRSAKERSESAFRWMWLTIVLSFGFYIPVVLWADTIHMTHEQLAQHISSAREAVARMLKQFSEDGLVELKRGTVTLRAPEGLKRLL